MGEFVTAFLPPKRSMPPGRNPPGAWIAAEDGGLTPRRTFRELQLFASCDARLSAARQDDRRATIAGVA